jgi:hypothetical protein
MMIDERAKGVAKLVRPHELLQVRVALLQRFQHQIRGESVASFRNLAT